MRRISMLIVVFFLLFNVYGCTTEKRPQTIEELIDRMYELNYSEAFSESYELATHVLAAGKQDDFAQFSGNMNIGVIYWKNGNAIKAIEYFDKAEEYVANLRENQYYFDVYYLRGLSYGDLQELTGINYSHEILGNYLNAIKLSDGLDKNDEYAKRINRCYEGVFVTYLGKGKNKELELMLNDLDFDDNRYDLYRVINYVDQNKLDEAMKVYERMKREKKGSKELFSADLYLALSMNMKNEVEELLKLEKTYLEDANNNFQYHLDVGRYFDMLGDSEQAKESFRRVAELNPYLIYTYPLESYLRKYDVDVDDLIGNLDKEYNERMSFEFE